MEITAYAPTRIDLSGGTLDIYPLYLFEDNAATVNIAIDLKSRVKISTRRDAKITIYSEDTKKTVKADNINKLLLGGELDLVARAVKFYNPKTGLDIVTKSPVPNGSGVGASSSLLMALCAALNAVSRKASDNLDIINWGANIEAQSINVPTGKQDYYAAVYGGINAIWFGVKGVKIEKIKFSAKKLLELEKSIILSYTGISHFSATHNWDMMKSYIDKNKTTRLNMSRIKNISFRMREALLRADIKEIAGILDKEWQSRKRLAKGVTNKKIDKLISCAASAGAYSSKICGAGGGGCMITMCPPRVRAKVENALRSAGAKILDFKIDFEGLKIISD